MPQGENLPGKQWTSLCRVLRRTRYSETQHPITWKEKERKRWEIEKKRKIQCLAANPYLSTALQSVNLKVDAAPSSDTGTPHGVILAAIAICISGYIVDYLAGAAVQFFRAIDVVGREAVRRTLQVRRVFCVPLGRFFRALKYLPSNVPSKGSRFSACSCATRRILAKIAHTLTNHCWAKGGTDFKGVLIAPHRIESHCWLSRIET